MPNIYHFKNLSEPMRLSLVQYIQERYSQTKSFNREPLTSAYCLKQPFTRLAASPTEHVTSQCFKEAMEYCGFKARLRGDDRGKESNWEFNIRILKRPRNQRL